MAEMLTMRWLRECRRERDKLTIALANIVVAIEREDAPAFRDRHYSDEDLMLLREARDALEWEAE